MKNKILVFLFSFTSFIGLFAAWGQQNSGCGQQSNNGWGQQNSGWGQPSNNGWGQQNSSWGRPASVPVPVSQTYSPRALFAKQLNDGNAKILKASNLLNDANNNGDIDAIEKAQSDLNWYLYSQITMIGNQHYYAMKAVAANPKNADAVAAQKEADTAGYNLQQTQAYKAWDAAGRHYQMASKDANGNIIAQDKTLGAISTYPKP